MNERISLAYDIPPQNKGPFSFYIDTDGTAYNYNLVIPSLNVTTEWIDKQKYLQTPLKYKVPPALSDYKIYWTYLKIDVRKYYIKLLRHHIEPLLRKFKITYLVDMDPTDFTEVKLNQKTDRQIMFLIAMVVGIVEWVWDQVSAAKGVKPKKTKSVIGGKKKTDKVE